jgi:hypothetical protein
MSKPLRLVPQSAQPIEFACPLCRNTHAAYIFGTSEFRVFRCGGCALTFSKPLLRTVERAPALPQDGARRHGHDESRRAALLAALDAAAIDGPVLVVADSQDGLIQLLQRRGIVIGHVAAHDLSDAAEWSKTYRAAIVSEAIMRVSDPQAALLKIRKHLPEGAPLLLTVPLLNESQARLMGRNWHEWQAANRWYFSRETLNLLLLAANFEQVWFRPERRRYSLDDVIERVHGNRESSALLRGLQSAGRRLPQWLRRREFRLPSGTAVITARAARVRTELVVSIVVPVFNEKATFQEMMDALLAKQLPGMRKEIIVVESNSTDGSRELVQSYQGRPDVRIVLQPSPRGKGNAVREGLTLATGDIVMIQDADMEYDFDDYDGLLAPLAAWQSMFILGSRHQGGWKMRKFNDAPVAAAILNFGHWFFTSAMNIALRTRMTDPFTMFKVFRRDALFGLDFVCNRFDFDIELVIKLVRKGYVPVELPVNYASRSFAEGKKVSFTRDGMTWLWTIAKLRFAPIGRGPV